MTDRSRIRYEIWTAPVPIDNYRPDFTPRPELGMCGLWPCQALVGESGNRYWFMLTIASEGTKTVSVSDASVIPDAGLTARSSPLLIDGEHLRTRHHYEFTEAGDRLEFRFPSGGHLVMDPKQYHWVDFGGKIDLTVTQKGDGVFFWIPRQDRIDCPIYHQSQTGLVEGYVDGDPVFGLSLLDYVWARPNQSWVLTEAFLEIEKHWTMWLVEYEDGTFDGGYAWSAKPPLIFDAGHLIQNEVSTGCQTAVTTPTFGDAGLPEHLHIDYGGQYAVELGFTHLADFPFHPVGHVESTSAGKPIKRSIAVTEWVPDNIEDLLYGRVPGCSGYADLNSFDAVIENHRVVPAAR